MRAVVTGGTGFIGSPRARPGELVRSCLDITRAQRDLRLPPPTPLPEGLARTLEALRAR